MLRASLAGLLTARRSNLSEQRSQLGRYCCFASRSDALARRQVVRHPAPTCINLRSAGQIQQSGAGDESAGPRPQPE
jgi:hypothetical protein